MSSISGTRARPFSVKRVLDPRRDLGIGAPLDDPLLLERAQAQREGARADPLERALELAEALASVGQVADHEERPLAGDDLRATTDWTGILSHSVGQIGQRVGSIDSSPTAKAEYSSMLYELK